MSEGGREDGKNRAQAVWGSTPAGSAHGGDEAVGSPEFFARARAARRREVPFVHELIPFREWRGRKVLELGCGLGFDAADLMAGGAHYVGLDLAPENPHRARAHLAPLGFWPPLLVADAEALPLADGSMDVVFSNGVLHHTPGMGAALREAHRVLGEGGELWLAVYHRHSVFRWLTLFLVDHLLGRGFLKQSFEERLSQIEWTTSDERPIVRTYSRKQLRRSLEDAGFHVRAMDVRRLQPMDLPDWRWVRALARRVPQRLWRWAGRRWGWYLVCRGVRTRVGNQ